MHQPASLFLEKSPKDLCPSSTHAEISKQIYFPYTPGIFKLLLLCWIFVGLFVVPSV